MQIRQQQQIRAFLSEKFGGDSDSTLFERQEALLQGCIARTEGKSPNQMKTLTETILPRVALYKALSERFPHEDAYKTMRAYMLEIVAPEKHSSTAKMEAIPGFYFLYSRIFLRVVRKSDLWESTQSHGKDHFEVTMKRCLWHTACVENGCAELCPCSARWITWPTVD